MPDTRAARRAAAATVLALAAGWGGCGGAGGPSDEAVVRGWAAEISRGDIEAATRRFAIPAEIGDVSGTTRLVTPAAVRFFNETLPCGARVTRTRDVGWLVIVHFRLVQRPGADCGTGAGGTASTAFEVRDGLITRWLRLPERFVPRESRDSAGGGLRHRAAPDG